MRDLQHVIIVGGGFSGVTLVAELLRSNQRPLRVTLIESGERLGRGLAYDTPHACHLLNTRADQMSLFADDPEHFVRWSRSLARTTHCADFLPRRIFGDYVEQSFKDLCRSPSAMRLAVQMQTRVTDVASTPQGLAVALADGDVLSADTVVLATGHPSPADPFAGSLPPETRRYLRDPWQHDEIAAIDSHDRVLVLGTGLTAVDVVLALEQQGHEGPIHAVSRRGLLPLAHAAQRQVLPRELRDALLASVARNDLQHTVRAMRHAAAAAAERGLDWHAVFDTLRPATARIWAQMCARDRRRFVRWLRPFWDVHRHRLPPEPAARIAALCDTGQLAIRAARLRGGVDKGGTILAEYTVRGSDSLVRARYDWIVNCTGPSFAKNHSRPLERRLLERGLLLPDPLCLGYVTGDNGAVIGARGFVPGLYVLGPGCRPNFWEHTAVPELRSQAASLAAKLIDDATLPRSAKPRSTCLPAALTQG